jgi:hypothetical protein
VQECEVVLTRELREWLRALIDVEARRRLAEDTVKADGHACVGCGCAMSERTLGCPTCAVRVKVRRRRLRQRFAELRPYDPRARGGHERWARS